MVAACNSGLYVNTQPAPPVVVSSFGGVHPFKQEEKSISSGLL